MIEDRERLGRVVEGFAPPDDAFEGLVNRRERKQRNRRIRAGTVGVIVALATAAVLARTIVAEDVPADLPKPIGAGEVLGMVWGLVAQDPDTGAIRTIVGPGSLPDRVDITAAAWSYDHEWVAFRASVGGGSQGGSIWLTDTVGGAPRRVARDGRWTPWVWSPTANQLAVLRGRDAILVDAATGHETDLGPTAGLTHIDGYAVRAMTWSPDGTRIAYSRGAGGGTVYVIDVASGEHSVLVPQPAGAGWVVDIDWSPDGAHLAITYERGSGSSLYLANADGSGTRLVNGDIPDGPWPVWIPGMSVGTAWSPDGTRLVYTDYSGPDQVWTVRADGSASSFVAAGGGAIWSPDGSQIAFAPPGSGDDPRAHSDRLVVNADGTGDPVQIDERTYRSWDGGSYFCFCYG